MNYLISGGAKNGKSMHAQLLAKNMATEMGVPLYYVATMNPVDEEDRNRIKRHVEDRDGWGFETLEYPYNIKAIIDNEEVNLNGVFLVDSTTALLANEMFPEGKAVNSSAGEKLAEDLVYFAKNTGNTIFVSDYIYSDARDFDKLTLTYRKNLALIDRELSRVCDKVIEFSYGMSFLYK